MIWWARVICLVIWTSPLLDSISTCSHFKTKCWYILNEPSGLTNFNLLINPDRVVTGIVTINGEINATSLSGTESEFLKLIKSQDHNGRNDDIMQLELQVGRNDHTIYVRGVLINLEHEGIPQPALYPSGRLSSSAQDYIIHPGAEGTGKLRKFVENRIRIQISDLEASKFDEYRLYLGDPGKADSYQFNYGSEENWQKFSNLRLNATRMVINDDEKLLASYTSISVCSDAKPVLCGDSREVIKATLGETLTLRCSGAGAPYLASKWENNNGISISDFYEEVSMDTADNYIESTHMIEHFKVDHIGTFICTIFNKNFNMSAKKSFSLQYSRKVSIIRSPRETFIPDDEITKSSWVIDGWPLADISLICSNTSEFDFNVTKDIFPNYSIVPRLRLMFMFVPKTAPDEFICEVFDADTKLDKVHFTKILKKDSDEHTDNNVGDSNLISVSMALGITVPLIVGAMFFGMWLQSRYHTRTEAFLRYFGCGNNNRWKRLQETSGDYTDRISF